MASVVSITPFNFPVLLLPTDGSIDTTYFIKLSKEELIWLQWKVKELSITSAEFSGWPMDAYIPAGSFDAFPVPRGLYGSDLPYLSERALQFVRTVFEAVATVTPDPPPNPYGFNNFYQCHVRFGIAPDEEGISNDHTFVASNVFRDRENDCYWVRPPSMELGAYVQYGGNPVVLHASSGPAETASRTHVGDLNVVLFGKTTTIPLISTPAGPGWMEITWPSSATASVTMEIGTLFPYSADMNDF